MPATWSRAVKAALMAVLVALVVPSFARAQTGNPKYHIFYYPWYEPGRHWEQGGHNPANGDIGSNFYPTLGAYDSGDDNVISQHMAWLQETGVGVIVVSWWGEGSYEDGLVPKLLNAANSVGIKVAWHMEPYWRHKPANPDDKPVLALSHPERVAESIRYINQAYGNHPAFYKHEDKGVFYVFESHLALVGGRPDWSSLSASDIQNSSIVLAQTLDPSLWTHFTGAYNYDVMDKDAAAWPGVSAQCQPPACYLSLSVGPGYNDDRAVPGNKTETRLREDGAFYVNRLNRAKNARPVWISITSFNEWHEGSQIEPARSTPPLVDGQQVYDTYDGAYGRTGSNAEMAYIERTGEFVRDDSQVQLSVYFVGNGMGVVTSEDGNIACTKGSLTGCTHGYPAGSTVRLWAGPEGGSKFLGWQASQCSGLGPCSVTMNNGEAVRARFGQPVVTNNIAGDGGGSVTASDSRLNLTKDPSSTGVSTGPVVLQGGTTVTLTGTAPAGSRFEGWSGECAGQSATCSVQKDDVWSATATFRAVSQIKGHVDRVTGTETEMYLEGWACAIQWPSSVSIHVYRGSAGGPQAFLTAADANLPSEPAVAQACDSTGTAYRFRVALGAWGTLHPGEFLWVYGISPFGFNNNALTNSGVLPGQVKGHIDGLAGSEGDPHLVGWACASGWARSIQVHVYREATDGAHILTGAWANLASDPAIAKACGSSGSAYRFDIPLASSASTYPGEALWVYGLSPFGMTNHSILNSGSFRIPGANPIGSVVASSCVGGCTGPWAAGNAIDGNSATAWSSGYHPGPDGYENLQLYFDTNRSVNYVRLVPRTKDGTNRSVPEFVNVWGWDAASNSWRFAVTATLPADISQSGHVLRFPSQTTTRLLVETNRLRGDGAGGYYFQLADVSAGTMLPVVNPLASVVASSCVGGCSGPWAAGNATDGNSATAWSSGYHPGPDGYENLQLYFDTSRSVNYVKLVPRTSGGTNRCVPEFVNIWGWDAATSNWRLAVTTPLPSDISQSGHWFTFPSQTTSRLLIETNRLRDDGLGGYYFQLAEVRAGTK